MVTPLSVIGRNSARAAPRLQHARYRRQALHYLIAAAAGVLHTLSFAPTPYGGWLQMVTFAIAFALISQARNMREAVLAAGVFGFAHFASGVFWLYISLHHYGALPAVLALAALGAFVIYLALYPVLAAVLWRACAPHAHAQRGKTGWRSSLIFASAWTFAEWLRGTLFTGFPWLANGYAQVDGPFAGYAAIVGVYGVGWLLALAAGLIVQAYAAISGSGQWARKAMAPLAMLALLAAGGMAASKITWTTPVNSPLTVRLLQGNIKQEMKFEQAGIKAALARYQALITARPADLIITSETALPMLAQNLPAPFVQAVRQFSDKTGSALILGAVGATAAPTGLVNLTNSLFGITPNSSILYRYDKHHLIPFGEFIPRGFRWLVNRMKIPLGDFARGPALQQPFIVRGQRLALNICGEDIFGEEIARTLYHTPTPGNILVNASNLAWFGNTIALDQHLQIARMRALETGRPMLRATNTGATAVIDANGRVIERLPAFTIDSLAARVQGMRGITPYIICGNAPVLILSMTLLACFAAARAVKRA